MILRHDDDDDDDMTDCICWVGNFLHIHLRTFSAVYPPSKAVVQPTIVWIYVSNIWLSGPLDKAHKYCKQSIGCCQQGLGSNNWLPH